MSDIQRHAVGRIDQTYPSRYGKYMLHADHVAALAAQATAHEAALAAAYTLMGASIQSAIEAEQAEHEAALASETAKRHAEVKAWSELSRDNFDAGYANGFSDERARVRAGVEALDGDYSCDVGSHLDVGAVLAVIDALRLDTADCLCPSPNPDCQHPTCPREGK